MPERTDRPAEAPVPKDLSKLMEQSVSTLQEVDRRLQMVRTDLANLMARAGSAQGPGGAGTTVAAPWGFAPQVGFPGPQGPMGQPTLMHPGFAGSAVPPSMLARPPLPPQGQGHGQGPGLPGPPAPSREGLPPIPRMPTVDLLDEGEHFVVHVELPGVKKEDLDLTVSDRMVQVHAETRPENGSSSVILLSERGPVRYERIIPFPAEVATNKCKASFKDGILTLTVPKKTPGEGPRKVDVAYG